MNNTIVGKITLQPDNAKSYLDTATHGVKTNLFWDGEEWKLWIELYTETRSVTVIFKSLDEIEREQGEW